MELVEILQRPEGKILEILPRRRTQVLAPHGVSKLRNRVIGRVLHALGLIERWGSGMKRMTAACLAAGLPAPVFASEIAATIGLSSSATRTRLARLVDRGLVREIGTGPQDPRRRYFLAEEGRA